MGIYRRRTVVHIGVICDQKARVKAPWLAIQDDPLLVYTVGVVALVLDLVLGIPLKRERVVGGVYVV